MKSFTLAEIDAYIAELKATGNGAKHEIARVLEISVLPALRRRKGKRAAR